ncbi:MAG: type III-A CRISPR-associated RAMP protein Csm5 [Candidatus Lokiarchaeota archaeon]|nr:type III-A CRISPR-associated RAMP protein Csm5 [Candidatus Lokiarchaeota archaeon]
MSKLKWEELGDSDKLELEGLSPVFIGSGTTYSQLDYIPDDNQIHIIDFNKVLQHVSERMIDDLTNDIRENFSNNIWEGDVKEFLGRYGITWQDFIERSYDLIGDIGRNEINQFNKTSDSIYIPGSSIKGAIRTAVLFSIFQKNQSQKNRLRDNVARFFNDQNIQNLIQSDGKNDLLRALHVSDATLEDQAQNIAVAESNVYHLRNKEFTIPIFNEVLNHGFQAEGSIKIDEQLLDSGYLKSNTFSLEKHTILNAINDFSREIISHELRTFTNQDDENLMGLIRFYKSLENELTSLNQNECILRVGQGSSILGITLFLTFQDNLEILRRYANLEVVAFDQPDRKNPGYAVGNKNGFLILPDKEGEVKPRINETWLCQVVSTNRRSHFKIVRMVEQIEHDFNIGEVLYPVTRKVVVSSSNIKAPYGWIKIKWT